jgi:hypothetical protein
MARSSDVSRLPHERVPGEEGAEGRTVEVEGLGSLPTHAHLASRRSTTEPTGSEPVIVCYRHITRSRALPVGGVPSRWIRNPCLAGDVACLCERLPGRRERGGTGEDAAGSDHALREQVESAVKVRRVVIDQRAFSPIWSRTMAANETVTSS